MRSDDNRRKSYPAKKNFTKVPAVKKSGTRNENANAAPTDISELRDFMGKVSPFRVVKLTPIGAYITPIASSDEASENASETISKSVLVNTRREILLPKNEFSDRELKHGVTINAFLYHDSEDRPIATLKEPALTIGGLALLKCTTASQIGAFLDWGLMKELFLPFKEQTAKIKPGAEVLVTLYTDKSSRLCASMKIYKLLRADSPYSAGDNVEGIAYEYSGAHGMYVAVDDMFSAMIPNKELMREVRIGERLKLRVSRVMHDGKLELSMREPEYLQINEDCDRILSELQAAKNGFLPYHDKTESLILKTKFNMSKNAFKRAIGHLYKQGLIEIREDGISLK